MEIRPLRGYRYAGSQSRDISAVVAPPYDQISPEMQDRLYRMSPHNIVRVTYPQDRADKYRDARDVLDGWLADGVWERDERPAIYLSPDVCRGRPFGHAHGLRRAGRGQPLRGVVAPHERTPPGQSETGCSSSRRPPRISACCSC